MNSQNVLYVLISFPETSETFIAEEIAALHAEGCAISILCMQSATAPGNHAISRQVLENSPLRVLDIEGKGQIVRALITALLKRPRLFLPGLLRWLRLGQKRWIGTRVLTELPALLREDYSGICVHFAARNLVAATTLSGFTGIPVSVTTHRFDIIDDPLPPSVARAEFHKCANIITISEANRELMQAKYGLSREQIQVLRCGIRTAFFSPPEASKAQEGSESPRTLKLVTIGRLEKVKAQQHLIVALGHLVQSGRQAHLTIIGEGPERARLERLIREYELEPNVTLTGSLPQDEVQRTLSESDLYLSTSESEGIPISCMEAMAMQLPIVAFTLPGLEELLRHRDCGLLVDQGDAPALADGIASLAADVPRLQSMGRAAREEILENYDRTKNAQVLKRLLANVDPHCHSRSGGPRD